MPRFGCFLFCTLALALTAHAEQGIGEQKSPGAPAAKDLNGDPLPPGAIARMGQDRWLHGVSANFAEFLPDGKTVVTVNSDNTIRVWEFPSGKEIRRISLRQSGVTVVPFGISLPSGRGDPVAALTKDGKTIAADNGTGEIIFHDVATGNKLPQRLELPNAKDKGKAKDFPVYRGSVDDLAFSPDGKQLASITGKGDAIIWDWAKAKQVHSIAAGASDNNYLFRVVYAPDGKSIATGYIEPDPMGTNFSIVVKLWEAASGAKK